MSNSNNLRRAQVELLKMWQNALIDVNVQTTLNGFLSYFHSLDDSLLIKVEADIKHLDSERDNLYYKKTPDYQDLISLRHNKKFVSILNGLVKPPVLEISCFNGWIGRALDFSAKEYIGIDPNPRYFNDDYLFIQSVAEILPFKDNFFNTVISKDSIDHYIDLNQSMKETERVLIPGGIFILGVQVVNTIEHIKNFVRLLRKSYSSGHEGLIEGLRQWLNGRKIDEQHVHHFSSREIIKLVCRYEFDFKGTYSYKHSAKAFIFKKR